MHKYQLGASVYLVCKSGKKYVTHEDMLEVGRLSVDEEGNHYSLITPDGDHVDWCREELVFGSRKDAEVACEDLNVETYTL